MICRRLAGRPAFAARSSLARLVSARMIQRTSRLEGLFIRSDVKSVLLPFDEV